MKQKIYKLGSILLTLALVLSTCICAIGTVAAATEATYYLSPTGDDTADGKTAETPKASVNAIIAAATEAGYGEGDTVYVKVAYVEGQSAMINTAESNAFAAHTFALNITSATAEKASLGIAGSDCSLGGDTYIDNIIFNVGSSSWPLFVIGNNNFYYGKGAQIAGGNNFDFTMAPKYNAPFTKDMTIYFGGLIKADLVPGVWNMPNYTADLTVIYDNAATNKFTFTSKNRDLNYGGNVNFVINGAAGFELAVHSGKVWNFAEGKAVSIINNNAAVNVATSVELLKAKTDVNGNALPYYVYSNGTGVPGAMEATDTVGKVKVNLNPDIYSNVALVNADGSVKAEMDAEGYITVPAVGEYTLTASKIPNLTVTYYVAADGNDANAGTQDAPLATVAKAIELANGVGYSTGDIVYVKATGAISWGTVPAHSSTLNVQSADPANKATLVVGALAGTTVIDNITLNNSNTAGNITLDGNSITLGAGVVTGGSATIDTGANRGQTIGKTQNVIINNAFNSSIIVGHNGQGSHIWNEDLNIVINNKSAAPTISYTTYWGGKKTIKGDYNVIVKNAASVKFLSPTENGRGHSGTAANSVIVEGAVNVIVPAATTVTGKDNITGLGASNYYVVDGIGGVELTDTVGKFAVNVNPERFQLLANGEAVEVVDGNVNLAAGTSELTLKLIAPYDDTYYVKADAIKGDGTEAAPFATVAEAIAAANAKGSIYGDNIAIKVVEAAEWGETEDFTFVPVVESANAEAPATLTINNSINGDVEFYNITLDSSAATSEGFKRIFANGKNIILGDDVQGNIEFVGAQQGAKYKNGQTVEINTAAVKNIYVGNTNQNNITFAGDVNYIFNNEELSTRFNFMPFYGHKIGIDGNFNIKVVAAKSITIGKASVEHEGDCQAGRVNITGEGKGANLIVPVATNVVGLDQFALLTDNYFVIRTGKEVDIDYTEFAGEYTFDYDEAIYNLVVTDAEGNALVADTDYSYDDGILFFFAPGEYTVALECIECIYDRECDNTCNRCGEVDETRVHKFSTYATKDAAECGKNATEIAVCDYGCGTEDVRDVEGSALEHNYQWIIDKANNCGVKGAKHEECSLCHEKRNENTAIAATGKHTYSNNCDTLCNVCKATRTITHAYKTTTTKATTSKNGSVVKACSVCGKQASKTTIYYAKKVKLSTTEYTYNGKSKKPSVKVYDYKGNKISSSNYEVSYKDNKKVGKATVTIKFKGNYSGTLKATFKILPKESKVEKLTAAKKSLKVKLDKVSSQATGYEIQYSTSSKFSSKYTKTKKVTSYKTTSVTLKSLKAKKTYYVRVRTYKTVDGKKYYSDWSSKKSKKTK